MELGCLGRYGPYPAPGGATSGYLVRQGSSVLALDMGAGTLARLLNIAALEQIQGVVITHWHPDHFSDLLVFAQLLQKLKTEKLPLFMPGKPVLWTEQMEGTGAFELHLIEAGKREQSGPFALAFAPTVHPQPGFAVRVEGEKTLVYTGDSVPVPVVAALCQGADALLCDAPFTKHTVPGVSPHMTVEQAAQMAKQGGVRQLYLTHLIPGADTGAMLRCAREIFPKTSLIEEEKTYTL